MRHMQETNHTNDVPALVQWDQPQFFFPTYENDHLLSLLEDVNDDPEVCVVRGLCLDLSRSFIEFEPEKLTKKFYPS